MYYYAYKRKQPMLFERLVSDAKQEKNIKRNDSFRLNNSFD